MKKSVKIDKGHKAKFDLYADTKKGDRLMRKIGILMITVLILTGCVQQIELTEQESDTIANYAAYVTLQHDKNYSKRLIETASESVEPVNENTKTENPEEVQETGEASVLTEDATTKDPTSPEGSIDTTTQDTTAQEEPVVLDIATVLKLDGFTVTYEGFEYDKQYQDTTVANGYTANSLDNNVFVVMKFNIENTTEETKLCDVLSLSPKINVSVNGEEAIKSYASLLNNDLTTLCNEIGAHESMEAILLVEVGQEYENNVSSISLNIMINGVTSSIALQ